MINVLYSLYRRRADSTDMPSLDTLHAGLQSSATCDASHVRKLCMILLTLVLEYPGLPSGQQGRSHIGQCPRDLRVNRDTYSELLRLFLSTRDDSTAHRLGGQLDDAHFEALSAGKKAAMLALMCNELLYCRNVVREIEGNIEEGTRLRGDKWAVEAKQRNARLVQTRRRVELRKAGAKEVIALCATRTPPSGR